MYLPHYSYCPILSFYLSCVKCYSFILRLFIFPASTFIYTSVVFRCQCPIVWSEAVFDSIPNLPCHLILRVRNKLAIHLGVLKDKMFVSKCAPDVISLTGVDNRNSGNYHEFQESLIALDN